MASIATAGQTGLHVAIAGAGLLGRLLAWRLSRAGHQVTVVDPAPGPQPPPVGSIAAVQHAAAFTAAGMLSPLAELDSTGPALATLGWRSLPLWRATCEALGRSELFRQHGSLLLAHPGDRGSAQRLLARLHEAPAGTPRPEALDATQLAALEPALAPGLVGWHLPGEGQVMPRELMAALHDDTANVSWRWRERVTSVTARTLSLSDGETLRCDWAIDTRGVAGQVGALQPRGVRGELAWLHAPGLPLTRPLRLLHPRHRVYLVPRPGEVIVVGASEIESEDRSPPSLRSLVELLAAAHSVLPELAEARLLHLEANLRPALPDHHPRCHAEPGLLQLNGLFRHGWLLAPALVDDALAACGLVPKETPHADTHVPQLAH
ncbi:FAD-binding oxidoreductase [Ideonella azotifigens]|uniref:Glycine oxidase ThiO n=1 Tax=Ideonella azotifigens TaxID=513160 RepID=A0ABP3VJ49_9BURK|nr:FAD-dependent oxidoreductase [Ideonella azotifigens]MCD2344128.1 FAD-binding oxidoreductase [Ideonella azotifigens]